MSAASIQRFEHQRLVHVVHEASWQHRSGQLKRLWVWLECDSMLRRCDDKYFSGRVVSARATATCLWCVGAVIR